MKVMVYTLYKIWYGFTKIVAIYIGPVRITWLAQSKSPLKAVMSSTDSCMQKVDPFTQTKLASSKSTFQQIYFEASSSFSTL